eukprot:Lithocolla_globosa_v1_NODE_435_length_4067_cov_23.404536.p3 type:complete len:104 gc:universal NODE_435_length_4067_cov_23.404536:1969-2280(+)
MLVLLCGLVLVSLAADDWLLIVAARNCNIAIGDVSSRYSFKTGADGYCQQGHYASCNSESNTATFKYQCNEDCSQCNVTNTATLGFPTYNFSFLFFCFYSVYW